MYLVAIFSQNSKWQSKKEKKKMKNKMKRACDSILL